MPSSLLTTEPVVRFPLHRPKLIFPIGSDGAGKTFWSRWYIERAAKRGEPLDICAADPPAAALAPLAHDADGSHPALSPQLLHQNWLEEQIYASAEARRSLILDPDPILFALTQWFTDTPVTLALEDLGLDFVAVYLLTPDPDSLPRLPYLLDLIKPQRTVIVLNELRLSADDGVNAFAGIVADPRVAAARADGARIVTMPNLPAPNRLDAQNPALTEWRDRMETNFASVAAWLD